MAKTRQKNSLVAAVIACAEALAIESIPNPTDKQLRQIHEAKVKAAGIIKTSGFVTLAETADEAIEAQHQIAEAEAEEAAARVAEADEDQDRIEEADAGPEADDDQPPLAELADQAE